MDQDIIFYQFSRSKVERADFSHFLGLYAPDKLPTGRRLRAMMNSMVFGIEGYDHDTREIHAIAEVRRFYSAFHAAWPYWLYFCNLDQDGLKAMVFCCLTTLTEIKVDGRAQCGVQPDPMKLLAFLGRDFGPLNAICKRGQMFEQLVAERTKQIFEYFRLPFEPEPPR